MRRVERARFFLREAAGSLGDLGTFMPLAVGMVQIVGLDAGTLLVTAGLVNIWGGLTFRIPIAVQPMKTICALAIAGTLSGTQAVAAGFFVGVSMLVVGLCGLVQRLARVVPHPVMRGVQLTVATELLVCGLQRSFGGAEGFGPIGWVGGAVLTLSLLRRRLEWASIGLLIVGLALAAWSQPSLLRIPQVALWRPHLMTFDLPAIDGIWRGGLPQVPLTLLNSVLAVAALAGRLYPQQSGRTTPSRMAFSVGIMNLLICPLGAMPLCHVRRVSGTAQARGSHRCLRDPAWPDQAVSGTAVRELGRCVDARVSAVDPGAVPAAGRLVAC